MLAGGGFGLDAMAARLGREEVGTGGGHGSDAGVGSTALKVNKVAGELGKALELACCIVLVLPWRRLRETVALGRQEQAQTPR